jgi:hypothetical protein
MSITYPFSFAEVRQVLGGVLGPDLHAKRIDSLCDAALGVLHSGSLAVAAIGHGPAAAWQTEQAYHQAGRPAVVEPGVNVDDIQALWVPYIVGARTSMRSPCTGPSSMPTTKLPSCCR